MGTSIDGLIARMDERLARAVEADDPAGYFCAVYRAVTARVRDGLDAGEFADCDRMERFDVAFGRYYLDAAAAHDAGHATSRSWAVAFDHAQQPLLVIQHVLLGMNAHINLDLGVAAVRAAPATGIDGLRDDFERINDVLVEMIDRMQAAIAAVSPWTGLLDRIGGRADELVSGWSIAHARAMSWRFAERLAAAGCRDELIADRDRVVAAIGRRIADPHPVTHGLLGVVRRSEDADVATVVEALRRTGADLPG